MEKLTINKLLLLFAVGLYWSNALAQDLNPDDLIFELDWFSWRVNYDGLEIERPSPNSEWPFISMDIAFDDPFSLSASACGTATLNFTFSEGDPILFTALVSDVVIDEVPCTLAINQEYSDHYFAFLQSLEGVEAQFQISIASPSGPELGPVSLQILHPNGDFANWADIPLSITEFGKTNLVLFPSPAADTIQWLLPNGAVSQARIFSLDGRLLTSLAVEGNKLSVAELPTGIYFLELRGPDGRVVKRFVKN